VTTCIKYCICGGKVESERTSLNHGLLKTEMTKNCVIMIFMIAYVICNGSNWL